MKKYHLADVLSLFEVFCAIAILVAVLYGWAAEWVLLIFGIGELCDALDGAAARKWPYPKDGKRRPWRNPTFIKHYEWAKDIALGLVTLAYIMVRVDLLTGIVCIALALVFGSLMQVYAGSLWVWAHTKILPSAKHERALKELEEFYVKRRVLMYVPAIVTIVLTLLYATRWPLVIKTLLVFGLAIGGIFLWTFKSDRRSSEDAEKLPKPSRLCMLILKVTMDKRLFTFRD